MDLTGYSISELVNLYSQTIKELKNRGVLRTKNVVGELGEYLVLEQYDRNPKLPALTTVPVGTKNINAINRNGERYSIKSTTGNVTGVIYGLQPPGSSIPDTPLFEYIIICKLDDDCGLEGIYQLSWDGFQKHKRWHSRMSAWNVAVTKAMKEDALVIFEKNVIIPKEESESSAGEDRKTNTTVNDVADIDADICPVNAVTWNKTAKVKHTVVREKVAERLQKHLKCRWEKASPSRYVTSNKETALVVLSASYSQKNGEYWYSINDETLPWMELFPNCYLAFALGSADHVLLFPYEHFKEMLKGCLRTKEEPEKNKKAHYHIAFAVEGSQIYFKKKLPKRDFINISKYLV